VPRVCYKAIEWSQILPGCAAKQTLGWCHHSKLAAAITSNRLYPVCLMDVQFQNFFGLGILLITRDVFGRWCIHAPFDE
ncbi:MAG: hypothetical protein P8J33_13135, partial [Pirellulaceae bacterium]|nr:hypothetical protein [Pirellulaceae bacterium]